MIIESQYGLCVLADKLLKKTHKSLGLLLRNACLSNVDDYKEAWRLVGEALSQHDSAVLAEIENKHENQSHKETYCQV